MSDNDNEIGAFLTGFIIGGLVGAAVALISAPQSGAEKRAQIRERSIEQRYPNREAVQFSLELGVNEPNRSG